MKIYTANMNNIKSYLNQGLVTKEQILDITVKSAKEKTFAPSWQIVMDHKNKKNHR